MRKKHLLLAAVLCLSMAAFVGCGNKDNNSDNQEMATPGADNGTVSPDNNGGNGAVDDVEDGVNDVINGAEDAVDDAVNGVEDATDDTVGGTDGQDNNNSVTSGKNDRDNADRR